MAVEILRIRVCDQCGSKDGVCRYRVTRTDVPKSATQDLCAECGAPLEAVLSKGGRKRKAVTPLADIATKKATAPRKRK